MSLFALINVFPRRFPNKLARQVESGWEDPLIVLRSLNNPTYGTSEERAYIWGWWDIGKIPLYGLQRDFTADSKASKELQSKSSQVKAHGSSTTRIEDFEKETGERKTRIRVREKDHKLSGNNPANNSGRVLSSLWYHVKKKQSSVGEESLLTQNRDLKSNNKRTLLTVRQVYNGTRKGNIPQHKISTPSSRAIGLPL